MISVNCRFGIDLLRKERLLGSLSHDGVGERIFRFVAQGRGVSRETLNTMRPIASPRRRRRASIVA